MNKENESEKIILINYKISTNINRQNQKSLYEYFFFKLIS